LDNTYPWIQDQIDCLPTMGNVACGLSTNVGIGTTDPVWYSNPDRIMRFETNLTATHGKSPGDPDVFIRNTSAFFRTTINASSPEDGSWFGSQSVLDIAGNQPYSRGVFTPGKNGSADIITGARGYFRYSGSKTLTAAAAVGCRADLTGGGTITNAMCYGSEKIQLSNNTTATNVFGLYLLPGGIQLPTGSTIVNTYGVYVARMTKSGGGTQVNIPYSFYASDPAALNYFAGNVGIGVTVPLEGLEMGAGKNIRIPNIKAPAGHSYYVCIDEDGTLTSQPEPCEG
jgi:hypothetical protein